MRSIRSFLLWRVVGGAALILSVAGGVAYVVVTRVLEAQFDQNLADRVQGLASLLFQVEDRVEFEFSDQLMPEYDAGPTCDYFQLCFDDGRPLERSNSLDDADLPASGIPGTDQPRYSSSPLPDGRSGRFAAQVVEVHHVFPEEGPDRPDAASVQIIVARGREDLVSAERRVLIGSAVVSLLLIGLIAGLTFAAVRAGIEPAARLAAALDAVDVERIPKGLDLAGLPAELEPIARKANALIRRVDTALRRERRTSADIAHELRTPISELVTVSEVALRDPAAAESNRGTLRTVRDVAWRMGRSISTLIKLSRLEMGAETFHDEPVDLGRMLREELQPLAAVERERSIRVKADLTPGEFVNADPDALRVIVSNLLSNALSYSPESGEVHCVLELGSGNDWNLCIENDALDLQPEDLPSISEPFWRKDGSRSDRDHAGLGLALSRALSERTGLRLRFELNARRFRAILGRGSS